MNDLSHGQRVHRLPPYSLIRRAALVYAMSAIKNRSRADVTRELYGDDRDLIAVMRTATNTADTTTAGWASDLVRQDTQAFVESIIPVSAYAALASRSLAVEFDAAGSVLVPFPTGDGTALAGAFVGEGASIPVKKGAFGSTLMKPYKMGVITWFTEELARSSRNAEAILGRMLMKDTAQALDTQFFSTNPGMPNVAPPGIVAGIPPIAPSAAATKPERALEDLAALVTAIVSAGNGSRIVIAMNTVQRLALGMMRVGDQWLFRDEIARGEVMGVELVWSRGIPFGNVYALDVDQFLTGLGAAELEADRTATFVAANADSAAPTHATDGGDRTAIGTPERVPPRGGLAVFDPAQQAAGKAGAGAVALSMFQQWSIALRNVFPVSWATARPGSVAWVSGADW